MQKCRVTGRTNADKLRGGAGPQARNGNRIILNRVGDTAMHIWTKSARKKKEKLASEDPCPFRHVSRIVDGSHFLSNKSSIQIRKKIDCLERQANILPFPEKEMLKKAKYFFILSPRRQRTETLVPLPHYIIF
jgi:hypothetical protein